jgi:hypothetical protein
MLHCFEVRALHEVVDGVDEGWIVYVAGITGYAEECTRASVPDAARRFIAGKLGKSSAEIRVRVQYYEPAGEPVYEPSLIK